MSNFLSLAEMSRLLDVAQSTKFVRERIATQPSFSSTLDRHATAEQAITVDLQTSSKTQANSYSAFLIGRIWNGIRAWIDSCGDGTGLARKRDGELVLLTSEYLDVEMTRLLPEALCFPTAHLRAIATEVVDFYLDRSMSEFRNLCPKQYGEFKRRLAEAGTHWFRRSPEDQLWTGMHTALSAHFRMGETVAAVLLAADLPCTKEAQKRLFAQATNFVSYIATSHLEVLQGVEGFVWDHAATLPAKGFACSEDGLQLLVSTELLTAVEKKLAHSKAPLEPRTGCPAFGAGSDSGSVMKDVQRWCETILDRHYWGVVEARYKRQ